MTPPDEAQVREAELEFTYLLNAMERAAQEQRPADHNYKGKREAVFAYVRTLIAAAEAGEKDARRYRYLNDRYATSLLSGRWRWLMEFVADTKDGLGTAIDAAIAKETK